MFREQIQRLHPYETIYLVNQSGSIKQSDWVPSSNPDQSYMPIKKKFFFFFWVTFHKTFVNYTFNLFFPLLARFLPILVVFIFHPLSFTLSLFFPLLAAFCQCLVIFFIHCHSLFTCSFPYWLSANFCCFSFIHFHPLFGGTGKGLELGTRKLDRRIIQVPYVAIRNGLYEHIRAGSFLALL
jgi:hypothetical protein